MKLSTRTRYGVRLMVMLASRYDEGPVYLREIAEEEQISKKYLSQIIIPLRAAGLVHSTRGAYGGYTLAKAPEDITMKDVIEVLEGEACLVDCVKNPAVCMRVTTCATRDIWTILGEKIGETLKAVTLAALVRMSRDKEQNILMSHI
ncbi:MAG: Rrf2 family transcriptional regulator [Deltaproteobacteria bacterium]|nr:Rrf2 family transcriptional regulator [Deltaproteobacteria bacterium]